MNSTVAPFPTCQESLRPGGPETSAILKKQHAFKRELVARMIADGAKELAHLATLVHLSEIMRMRSGDEG